MSGNKNTLTLSGRTLSPGLAEGKTFIYRDILTRLDEFYDIEEKQVEEELKRLDRAIARILDDLKDLAGRVQEEIDPELSGIFHAHIAMVQDRRLREEMEKEIRDELVSAGSAVRTAFRRWERRFRSLETEIARQKGDDMHDLARRLVSSLAGIRAHALEELPAGSVLVANRLLPSDAVFLSQRTAAAALLEKGGPGSHAALFARETGLPCIAGLTGLLEKVSPDTLALVDADEGKVIIHPGNEEQSAFRKKVRQRREELKKARVLAHQPAVTGDGIRIHVLANVGSHQDTAEAIKNGAEGIGLYRIEQAYLGRQEPPDTDELLEEMRKTLEPAGDLPVYVRLLDIGADKPLPFIDPPIEANPALGQRGVRFLQKYPRLLQTQLEGLLQLSSEFDLHILVPMVTLPRDMLEVREHLTSSASRSGISSIPKLGAMIETPAAALSAGEIARYADFLSFGTNDLTQYAFAADRENADVDRYFDDSHHVIFRLLEIAHADVPGMPLSVCGELAGRPEYTSKLLSRGVTSLSVAPPLVPGIKKTVRQSKYCPNK